MKFKLRKVIRQVEVPIIWNGEVVGTSMREELECGHVVRIPRDWYGETATSSRRCKKCGEA